MSIRQLGEGKWQICYYPLGRKGKYVRHTFYGKESDARTLELELRQQHAGLPQRDIPRINDIMHEYLRWFKMHRMPRTYEDVKKSLKWLLPVFGRLQVHQITPSLINEYKESRYGKVRATNKELNYLKGIIAWMVRNYNVKPLFFKIEMLPYRSPLPQIPHPSDIQTFIDAIRDRMKKALVLLMYMAGLRFGDAVNIRWENIDWKSGTIKLVQKGGSFIISVLPEPAKLILIEFKKDNGYVFGNPRTGVPYKSVKTLFKSARKASGIKINPHLLRHAFGTYVLDATGDLRLVQELMGHKSINTTTVYTKIAMARKKLGYDKFVDYTTHLKTLQPIELNDKLKPNG